MQSDHLSGKPGNVREFDSCEGNVGGFYYVREKLTVVSCIFASIP